MSDNDSTYKPAEYHALIAAVAIYDYTKQYNGAEVFGDVGINLASVFGLKMPSGNGKTYVACLLAGYFFSKYK